MSCDERAWHAGASRWRGRDDCNDFSIGIELEGLEGETFEDAQYAALARPAARRSRVRYPIARVAGHEHVAPGRKNDPGRGLRLGAPAPPRAGREARFRGLIDRVAQRPFGAAEGGNRRQSIRDKSTG